MGKEINKKPPRGRQKGGQVIKHRNTYRPLLAISIMFIILIGFNGWTEGKLREIDRGIEECRTTLGKIKRDVAELERAVGTVDLAAYATEKEVPERVSLGIFKITGYVPGCAHCCGQTSGIMANGETCVPWVHCAAGNELSFGETIEISGLGRFKVADRGVSNGVIDVACNTHEECYKITGHYEVFREVEVFDIG